MHLDMHLVLVLVLDLTWCCQCWWWTQYLKPCRPVGGRATGDRPNGNLFRPELHCPPDPEPGGRGRGLPDHKRPGDVQRVLRHDTRRVGAGNNQTSR